MTIEEERAAQLAVIEEEIRGLTESPLYEYRTLNPVSYTHLRAHETVLDPR